MKRRYSLAGLAGLAALPTIAVMKARSQAVATESPLKALKPSPRLPVMFVGHGSPMNAIQDNRWRRTWQQLGQTLRAREVQPQLVLSISAHWLTRGGWWLTGMARPKTIHDFGGFPQALFDQQYPAPGAPEVAQSLAQQLRSPATGGPLTVDADDWGLDHGTWSVLAPMFPDAAIPVMQLSMDYSRPAAEHYALGRQLRALRERGVLIVGSGNAVHNLRAVRRDAPDGSTYDWGAAFDDKVATEVRRGDLGALVGFQQWGPMTAQAHPTHEHYLPLLYAAGAVHDGEAPQVFNDGFQFASISMRSMLWG